MDSTPPPTRPKALVALKPAEQEAAANTGGWVVGDVWMNGWLDL